VLGLDVSLLRLLEVDDAPDGIEVVRFDVFVLQVEGMLPDVDSDDRLMGKEGVLVCGGDDLEFLRRLVVPEPTPATTLDCSGDGVHPLFELLDAAEIFNQGIL